MNTIQELIEWFKNECQDGMTEPKEILEKMYILQENIESNFKSAVNPAIRYLLKNHDPHTKIFIDYSIAVLTQDQKCTNLNNEIPD